MKKAEGFAINEEEDHWIVNCPDCEKEFEYTGYFDSSDITKCSCGCNFVTIKVWINDESYIY